MRPLELVNLAPLMQRTSGRAEVKVAVIDGPVAVTHPDLSSARIHEVSGRSCRSTKAPSLSDAFTGVHQGRRDRFGQRRQAHHICSRNQAVWWLPTSSRRTKSMDGLHPVIAHAGSAALDREAMPWNNRRRIS